ncbi:MAG: glycosyltransferase family 2 protein [Lactobacillales bacterium]|jgi:glycosyltransferase involved in cell wall biosynthesis|nr:glycosyltransferase family 2 protein [Lactobacillales bacterium]
MSKFVQLQKGIPKFSVKEYKKKQSDYCLLIPIINEKERIHQELLRAKKAEVSQQIDIIICDGGSVDGSTKEQVMKTLDVNTLLVKDDAGKQGAQLRIGIFFALKRGYQGMVTIDGNNKDSIEDVSCFVEKLKEGYDFIQGSRYIKGGHAINTPLLRHFSVKFIHAPIISFIAKKRYTDTTNAFRAYSRKYLEHSKVQPLRDIFQTYELLAYLSVRADQLGMKTTEIPVTRSYPKSEKTPTKISPFKGNLELLKILLYNLLGKYNP